MAFPGGRAEKHDRDILHTARRETCEEIGLDTRRYTCHIGRLSDVLSGPRRDRKPLIITPHVFSIADVPELTINHEVDRVVWVPLNYLADSNNRQQMAWPVGKKTRYIPRYMYQDHMIWGLSLRMLDELVSVIKS